MIYHIISREKWDSVRFEKYYEPSSLIKEGYIHCSFEDQFIKVAESYYKGQKNLLVLRIKKSDVESILKIEDLFNLSEKYPHLYGPLPISAITHVLELNISEKGDFIKPTIDLISSLLVEQGEWT